MISHAVSRDQLAGDAGSPDGLAILASLHFGVLSQHLANEPETAWGEGLYTRSYSRVIDLFVAAFPPP